jgi:hypothetical protein
MIPPQASLHTGRLILTPEDPLQAADEATIVPALKALGLLGPARPVADGQAFRAGNALGEVIGFTGCAVQFAAPDQGAESAGPWIRIPSTARQPRLLFGRNTRPPRCPACAAPLRDWRGQLPPSAPMEAQPPGCDATLPLQCGTCGAGAPAYRWRWGRHAGAGRSLVSVEEVFPGEAAPLPALLTALAGLSAGPWGYFFVQD